ncbi:hypothetical protein EV426DRAFT_612208 [Tirmania nivea]|nr:hypothetical protein EV426DRAFT_612208 [Tirmania nivea]
MPILLLITLLFLLPLLLFLVYLALSSCLGASLRNPRLRPTSRPYFGNQYIRASSGLGAWEGIEMAGIVREDSGAGDWGSGSSSGEEEVGERERERERERSLLGGGR